MLWCDSHSRAITAKLSANIANWVPWFSRISATEVEVTSVGMSTSGSTNNVIAMATTASANAISRDVPSALSTPSVCQLGRPQELRETGASRNEESK